MGTSPLIIAGASVGAVFLLCVCLSFFVCCICCCIKCLKSKHSSKRSHQFPKFRVIDAPNATFMKKAVDIEADFFANSETLKNGVIHNLDNDDERLDTRGTRSPAKLPTTDSVNELATSEYSYALPSEIRVLPFHEKDLNVNDLSEIVPIRRHRASTDSQLPSRKEGYGSTMSSPSSCADYTSPVISCGSTSPNSTFSMTYDPQNIYTIPESNEESLYMQIKSLDVPHIDRTSIEIHREIGSGNFGCVVKCTYNESTDKQKDAAAKTLKETSATIDKIRFLQEAAIMGQFHHRNIVKVYGVVVSGTPLMIVLELMPKGDLRNFLIQIKPDKHSRLPELLLKFCREIASGMDYLSIKSFIHRDLAARNVLLNKELTCKIGDFGLARDLMDEEYYFSRGGVMPVRWTAPEALNYRKYSMTSDVWSYGCLLYEIWSLGHKPYGRKTNKEVLTSLEEGTRLHPPPGCTRSIYYLMIQCWHPNPSSRPSFADIVNYLDDKDDHLLSWTDNNRQSCGPDSRTLGASLTASESLYIDLQLTYVNLK